MLDVESLVSVGRVLGESLVLKVPDRLANIVPDRVTGTHFGQFRPRNLLHVELSQVFTERGRVLAHRIDQRNGVDLLSVRKRNGRQQPTFLQDLNIRRQRPPGPPERLAVVGLRTQHDSCSAARFQPDPSGISMRFNLLAATDRVSLMQTDRPPESPRADSDSRIAFEYLRTIRRRNRTRPLRNWLDCLRGLTTGPYGSRRPAGSIEEGPDRLAVRTFSRAQPFDVGQD